MIFSKIKKSLMEIWSVVKKINDSDDINSEKTTKKILKNRPVSRNHRKAESSESVSTMLTQKIGINFAPIKLVNGVLLVFKNQKDFIKMYDFLREVRERIAKCPSKNHHVYLAAPLAVQFHLKISLN